MKNWKSVTCPLIRILASWRQVDNVTNGKVKDILRQILLSLRPNRADLDKEFWIVLKKKESWDIMRLLSPSSCSLWMVFKASLVFLDTLYRILVRFDVNFWSAFISSFWEVLSAFHTKIWHGTKIIEENWMIRLKAAEVESSSNLPITLSKCSHAKKVLGLNTCY